jgi:hypothetical protein
MFPTTTAFNQSNWSNKEVREKLHVVTMSKLNKYPLTEFNSLSLKEKRIANEILNDYIRKFPEKGWEDKLTKDFNQVCVEEIFENPKIDFTTLPIKQKDLADYPVEETDMVKHLV